MDVPVCMTRIFCHDATSVDLTSTNSTSTYLKIEKECEHVGFIKTGRKEYRI
jgi:hypothetical protein